MTTNVALTADESVDVFMNWVRETHVGFSQSGGNIQLNERRVRLLFSALYNLYLECLSAGHGMDVDYNWGLVMKKAKEALNK